MPRPRDNSVASLISRAKSCLLRKAKLRYPVMLERRDLSFLSDDGTCFFVDHPRRQFIVIWIDSSLDETAALDALAHEWAHALTITYPGSARHDKRWGEAFARAYRATESVRDGAKRR